MKKVFSTIVLSSAIILGLSSCTKKYYEVNETYQSVPSKVMVYTVTADKWSYDGNNRLIATLSVNELTQYYMEQGIVTLAVSKNNEASYSTIPAVIEAVSYSFDYEVGKVIVYMEDPIMESGVTLSPPDKMIIKVGLTEADYVE
jgi:hypothetical protein